MPASAAAYATLRSSSLRPGLKSPWTSDEHDADDHDDHGHRAHDEHHREAVLAAQPLQQVPQDQHSGVLSSSEGSSVRSATSLWKRELPLAALGYAPSAVKRHADLGDA